MATKTGNDLFIVNNSDDDWKVLNYLPFEVYAKSLQAYFNTSAMVTAQC